MKKTLVAAAILGLFAGSALAESSVTLYGFVDTGLVYQHIKNPAGKSDNFSMESGINETSVWGLEGKEEIGDIEVSFKLESAYLSDSGHKDDEDRLFGEEAQVSVSGRYGTLTLGRVGAVGSASGTYDTVFSIGDAFDGGDYDVFGMATSPVLDNSLTYQSPELAGLQLTLQASTKADSGDKGGESTSEVDRYLGGSLTYKAGNLEAVAAYEYINWENSPAADRTIAKDGQMVSIGANYNFEDVAKVFAMAQAFKGWNDAAQQTYRDLYSGKGLHGFKGWDAHLGAVFPVAGGDLTAGLYYADAKAKFSKSGKDVDAKYYGAAARYAYPLSKRTSLYCGLSYGQAELDHEKEKVTTVYSGITHMF